MTNQPNESVGVEKDAKMLWDVLIDHMNVDTKHVYENGDCTEVSHILEFAALVDAQATRRERLRAEPLLKNYWALLERFYDSDKQMLPKWSDSMHKEQIKIAEILGDLKAVKTDNEGTENRCKHGVWIADLCYSCQDEVKPREIPALKNLFADDKGEQKP